MDSYDQNVSLNCEIFNEIKFTTLTKINRRERFFKETLKLIHKKGFKATTMRDIAQNLDFEVGNVYNYIDSKDALLETYLFDVSDEFHEAIDVILKSTGTPKKKLQSVISSYISITANKPYEQALLVNEWRHLKKGKLKEFISRREAYEYKLKGILIEGINQKMFRPTNVDLTTQTIMATLRWLYKVYIAPSIKMDTKEIEKELTDFILLGVSEQK